MSFEEKGTWASAFITAGAYLAYVAIILGRAENVPLSDVSYISTMLWTIAIVVGLSILGHIVIAISKPSEADKRDARDKEVYRFGEYIGGIVLGVGLLIPLGLALAEFAHFWIANAIFLLFVISSTTSSVVKIVAYRRGL
jgi:hypothetical protein